MYSKLATVLMAYCLIYFSQVECSFIKPNSVPRIGRSNEDINSFDQGNMGYVIKTSKNIPRMGRRNYDSENRYENDIPKFSSYQQPSYNMYEVADPMPVEAYPYKQFTNMKR